MTPSGASSRATSMAVASPSMRRVRADDGLADGALRDPVEELVEAQLLAPDAVERAQRAPEHVVAALEAGALHGDDVAGVLDDADDLGVAPVVAADGAQRAATRPR